MLKKGKRRWSLTLPLSIISIVAIMVAVFFMLTSHSIVALSRNNMALRSECCADQLDGWTGSVVNELSIYKQTIEDNFSGDDAALDKFLSTIYRKHDAYPMGIYIGDETGYYGDSSGWEPGEDWVLEERPWYIDGKESSELVFGEPYIDSMTGSLCISASVKMDVPGVNRVMSADVYLDYAAKLANDLAGASDVVDGAVFVTADDRIIIADSDDHAPGSNLQDQDGFYQQLDTVLDASSSRHTLHCGGIVYYVNVAQMDTTGWYLITYVRKHTLLAYLYRVEMYMAAAAFLAAVLLTIVTLKYAGKFNVVQRSASTDTLTGVYNRGGFEERVAAAMEENPDRGILLVMDMDNFKAINDNLGHPEGDSVLLSFARLLDAFFNRRNEIVARIGGDEFAVYIGQSMDEECLRAMLYRLQERVRDTFSGYEAYHLSVSIGAACRKPGMGYEELYKLADKTLYDVKRNGKAQFSIVYPKVF